MYVNTVGVFVATKFLDINTPVTTYTTVTAPQQLSRTRSSGSHLDILPVIGHLTVILVTFRTKKSMSRPMSMQDVQAAMQARLDESATQIAALTEPLATLQVQTPAQALAAGNTAISTIAIPGLCSAR